jgi:large subunit ribosomal protein L29
MEAKDIIELSVEDLKVEIAKESKALNTLKLNHAVSPLENPQVIKTTRRLVARLKTVLTQKEQV